MSKKVEKNVKIPIYDRGMVIIVTKNINEEAVKAGFDDNHIEMDGAVAEVDGIVYVFIDPKANINTICHEAFHVTKTVLCDAGLELGDASEEAFAYLVGWIAEKINKVIKKY